MSFHGKPSTYVGRVHLKVANLERSIQFYTEVIGFQVLSRSEKNASLTAKGSTNLLSLEQLDDAIPLQPRRTGLYHFALLLPSRVDLANVVVHLAEKRVPLGSADHLVSEAIYLSDPDGNGIEIYRDRDPSQWQWGNGEVAMVTDPLNFQDLLASRQEGEKWSSLPEDTIMGHIHLHVADLKTSEAFYVDGLGFEVVNRFGKQALFISTGKYHHHIGLNTWQGIGAPPPDERSVGLAYYMIHYPDHNARDEAVDRLIKMGAEVRDVNDMFETADPSGNRIQMAVT